MNTNHIYCVSFLSTFSKEELIGFKSFLSVESNLVGLNTFNFNSINKLGNALVKLCLIKVDFISNTKKRIEELTDTTQKGNTEEEKLLLEKQIYKLQNEIVDYEKLFSADIEEKLFVEYKGDKKKFDLAEKKILIKELREYLLPQAKLFLALEQLKTEKQQIEILVLNKSINNCSRFDAAYKKTQNFKYKLKGSDFYKFSYQLEDLKFFYDNINGKNYSKIEIDSFKKSIDQVYAINKLEVLIGEISLNYINQNDFDFKLEIEEIKDFVKIKKLFDEVQIVLLLKFLEKCYNSIQTKNIVEISLYYDELFLLLDHPFFKNTDKTGLDKILLNNLMIRIFRGEDLLFELHKTYKKFLVQKKIVQENSIDLVTFRSMISSACRVGEIKWAKDFYKSYLKYTPKEKKTDVKDFFEIMFNFYEKDFEKTVEAIEKSGSFKTTINTDYEVAARVMFLKSLYSIPYEERFFLILKKEKQFFQESKYLNDDKKNYYFNFAKILENLIKIKNKDNLDIKRGDANKVLRASLVKIEEQLKSKDLICDKPWILEKVKELKNSELT